MSAAELAFYSSDPLVAVDSPCVDCPVNWHLSRLAEGRCNGTPGDDPERVKSGEWKRANTEERLAIRRRRYRHKIDAAVADSYPDSRCSRLTPRTK
jgi:hypothetical protein